MCGARVYAERKPSSPRRSSPWRILDAATGAQHSCHLRRTPIRAKTYTAQDDDDSDDLPIDSRPLTRLISAFTDHTRSQLTRWRNDGFDAFLHQTPIKPRRW